MDIQVWMGRFLDVMKQTFGGRLAFVGLQGSRGRGEGREDSDIDVVVILDRLTPADLDAYRAAVAELPRRELLCGFVSGWAELERWDAADLFQFYHDTTPYLGTLDALLPRIDRPPSGGRRTWGPAISITPAVTITCMSGTRRS